MIQVRPATARGRTELDWLASRHSFSFGDYYDPANAGFSVLRVLNEDWIQPGGGFGMHPHRDMEIITYMVSGALEHQDSLGNGGVIRPGEVQRMTAGRGILHSEFNASPTEPAHLLQIWLLPDRKGLPPGYEQQALGSTAADRLQLVAAPAGRDGALTIHQNVDLWAGKLAEGVSVTQELRRGRHAWVQVPAGTVTVNGQRLSAGDGAAITDEPALHLKTEAPAELLLFDLP